MDNGRGLRGVVGEWSDTTADWPLEKVLISVTDVLPIDVGVSGIANSFGALDRPNRLLNPNLDSLLLTFSGFKGTRFSSAAITSMSGGRLLRDGV